MGAFSSQVVGDVAGGVGDIFSGYSTAAADDLKAEGLFAEAKSYGLAGELAGENEKFTEESTAIQLAAQERNFEKVSGQSQADIAGAGFANSGSAQDIMRENAQQGAVAHQLIAQQGLMTEAGYTEQQQSYKIMQDAANAAGEKEQSMADDAITAGWVTGGLKFAAAAAMFI